MQQVARFFTINGDQIVLRADEARVEGDVAKYDESGRSEIFAGSFVDAVAKFMTEAFGSVSDGAAQQIAGLKASAMANAASLENVADSAISEMGADYSRVANEIHGIVDNTRLG